MIGERVKHKEKKELKRFFKSIGLTKKETAVYFNSYWNNSKRQWMKGEDWHFYYKYKKVITPSQLDVLKERFKQAVSIARYLIKKGDVIYETDQIRKTN